MQVGDVVNVVSVVKVGQHSVYKYKITNIYIVYDKGTPLYRLEGFDYLFEESQLRPAEMSGTFTIPVERQEQFREFLESLGGTFKGMK